MNVYEIVTQKIIKELEKGVIPWRKTWIGESAMNWVTRVPYKGINRLLLDDGEYITYKQCLKNHGKIKKGAKAHIVIFWKLYEKEICIEGNLKTELLPVLKYYCVYNISDCIGIYSKLKCNKKVPKKLSAEKVIQEYTQHFKIDFKSVNGSNSAYYNPDNDIITLPSMNQFENSESYYSVAFHELIHSTGHSSRLNRIRSTKFASNEYSKEELIAEISSSMLMTETGIELPETFDNSVAYIKSWLNALKSDSHMIVIAAAQAQKAVELILGKDVFDNE